MLAKSNSHWQYKAFNKDLIVNSSPPSKKLAQRKKEAEDKLKVLHETLNLIQIQFKRNILVLQDIDQQIQDYLFVFLEENHDKFSDKDFENLKIITKSLIFTLIPLHNNEKCIEFYKLLGSKFLQ